MKLADRIYLALCRAHWRGLLNTVIQISVNGQECVNSKATIFSSKRLRSMELVRATGLAH